MLGLFAFTLLAASTALAAIDLRHASFHSLARLGKRQTRFCQSVPADIYSCETSCGAGYVQCGSSEFDCFNPGKGEICCGDGSYCPSGEYCTDAWCCDNNESLEECGASHTLSTLPATVSPPAVSSSAAASTPATASSAVVTSSSAAVGNSSYAAYTTASSYASTSAPVYTPAESTSGYAYTTTTASSYTPMAATGNAAPGWGVDFAGLALAEIGWWYGVM